MFIFLQKFKNEDAFKGIDFFETETLCNLPLSLKYNKRFHVLLLLHNPRTYMMESDYTGVTKDNNKISNDGTSFISNRLTRSILCKMEGRLTNQDLIDAKYFLKEKSTVGVFNNYMDAINLFHKEFHWKDSANSNSTAVADNEKCIRRHFQGFILKHASHYRNSGSSMNLELMHHLNLHDSNIYSEYFAQWNKKKMSLFERNIEEPKFYIALSYIIVTVCALSIYFFLQS